MTKLIGSVIRQEGRFWTVRQFFLPAELGVRARLTDQSGATTFINQRDLEVLLHLVRPGSFCEWLGSLYLDPLDPEFVGFACSAEDLLDDLYSMEMELRRRQGSILPGTSYTRQLVLERGVEVQQTYTFLWDLDPTTGLSPDTRFSTIERRWVRVEEVRL